MDIHPQQKQKLRDALVEGCQKTKVENRLFPERWSFVLGFYKADKSIEGHGKIRRELEGILGESPIFDFVSTEIRKTLRDNENFSPDEETISLTDCGGFDDIEDFCDGLVEKLESLPRRYHITFALPKNISKGMLGFLEKDCRIGPFIFTKNAKVLDQIVPISNIPEPLNSNLFRKRGLLGLSRTSEENASRSWKDGDVFLRCELEGYIEYYGVGETTDKLWALLRALFGYMLALNILSQKRNFDIEDKTIRVVSHVHSPGGMFVDNRFEMPDKLSKSLSDLIMSFETKLDGEERVMSKSWTEARLPEADNIFADLAGNQRIIAACSWLFDAYANDDSLLGFIQAMVSLEIILGDEKPPKDEGLGVILRNRCAYLIAESLQERDDLMEEFKKIYDVRSKIVHRGKSKLNREETRMLNRLMWMSGRVIHEEVKLLLGSKQARGGF